MQTKRESCQSCHGVINPLGFTLEHFDAVGRYRDQDNGKPVDATGAYQTRTGETLKFAGARDLAEFLAGSEEVQTAFGSNCSATWPSSRCGRTGPKLTELRESFAKNGFSIRKLMVEAATAAALMGREVKAAKGEPGT